MVSLTKTYERIHTKYSQDKYKSRVHSDSLSQLCTIASNNFQGGKFSQENTYRTWDARIKGISKWYESFVEHHHTITKKEQNTLRLAIALLNKSAKKTNQKQKYQIETLTEILSKKIHQDCAITQKAKPVFAETITSNTYNSQQNIENIPSYTSTQTHEEVQASPWSVSRITRIKEKISNQLHEARLSFQNTGELVKYTVLNAADRIYQDADRHSIRGKRISDYFLASESNNKNVQAKPAKQKRKYEISKLHVAQEKINALITATKNKTSDSYNLAANTKTLVPPIETVKRISAITTIGLISTIPSGTASYQYTSKSVPTQPAAIKKVIQVEQKENNELKHRVPSQSAIDDNNSILPLLTIDEYQQNSQTSSMENKSNSTSLNLDNILNIKANLDTSFSNLQQERPPNFQEKSTLEQKLKENNFD